MAQAFFMERKAVEALETMELELGFVYDMVYTKGGPVAHTTKGWVLRAVCSVCLVSALVIFCRLDKDKHGMSRVDVGVTYALLLGGVALDVVALSMLLLSDRAAVFLQSSRRRRWFWLFFRWPAEVGRRWWQPRHWSRAVAQFNLIGYCAQHRRRYGWRSMVSSLLSVILEDLVSIQHQSLGKISYYTEYGGSRSREVVVQKKDAHLPFPFCFIRRRGVSRHTVGESFILEMFFRGVADLLRRHSASSSTDDDTTDSRVLRLEIEQVLNCRGKIAIDRLATRIKEAEVRRQRYQRQCRLVLDDDEDIIDEIKAEVVEEKFQLIVDSVTHTDFDESLLLWHIATDLCRLQDTKTAPTAGEARSIGETLSEYMLYLLIKQPEMLAARTGIWLMRYRDTCEEARRFFGSMEEAWTGGNPDDARRMLLSVNTSEKPSVLKGDQSKSVLFDAVILAKTLRELDDDELMWDVITGVWTEMLLYAARNCPGSTHVRHLSRGGELITIIWFLMEHMGLGNAHDANTVGDVPAKLIVHL